MSDRLISVIQEGDKTLELFESSDRNVEIYVDGIHGLMAGGSHVKVNFFSRGFDHESTNSERRDVACRVVMGVDTFFSLAEYFNKSAEELKTQLGVKVIKRAEEGSP